MVFNMKRFLIVLLVCHVFAAQAGIDDWAQFIRQRPQVALKAVALVPLGFSALYFGGYTYVCAREALDAYKEQMVNRDEVRQKSFESLVSAGLALACAKLAQICYKSLTNDIA